MRAQHRKSLWLHTAFSLLMCAGIAALILIRRDTPGVVLGILIALYVIGNTYLHIKRDDFKKETLYEYILVGVSVFIVIFSAVLH